MGFVHFLVIGEISPILRLTGAIKFNNLKLARKLLRLMQRAVQQAMRSMSGRAT